MCGPAVVSSTLCVVSSNDCVPSVVHVLYVCACVSLFNSKEYGKIPIVEDPTADLCFRQREGGQFEVLLIEARRLKLAGMHFNNLSCTIAADEVSPNKGSTHCAKPRFGPFSRLHSVVNTVRNTFGDARASVETENLRWIAANCWFSALPGISKKQVQDFLFTGLGKVFFHWRCLPKQGFTKDTQLILLARTFTRPTQKTPRKNSEDKVSTWQSEGEPSGGGTLP